MKINSQRQMPHVLVFVSQLLFVNLVLVSCPIFGQVKPTKALTAADYHLWSTLHLVKISDDGKWVSYGLEYESGADTLFLKDVAKEKTTSFANARMEQFDGSQSFGIIDAEGNLIIRDLKGKSGFTVSGVSDYRFLGVTGKIAVLRMTDAQEQVLEIRDRSGQLMKTINGVEQFVCSPVQNKIGYITIENGKSAVGVLSIGKQFDDKPIVIGSAEKIVNMVWQANGEALAFVTKCEHPTVSLFKLRTKKLFTFSASGRKEWDAGMTITAFQREFLTISDDGERVCFLMEEQRTETEQQLERPQVWKSDDVYLYPAKGFHRKTQIGVWSPETDAFIAVGGKLENVVLLTGNGRYAVTADVSPYVPTVKFSSDADYYITDCDTGSRRLLLKQFVGESDDMLASPDGKYLVYFRENDWWVYSIGEHTHTNVTKGINSSFEDIDYDWPGAVAPYGAPHWSSTDQTLYLYDEYDIWAVSTDGKQSKRVTTGRERNLQLRFAGKLQNLSDHAYFIKNMVAVDLRVPAILEGISKDYSQTGYFSLTNGSAEKQITMQSKSLKGFRKVKDRESYLYISQQSDVPPAIVLQEGKKMRTVFQSNKHFDKYGSSKSEAISYTDSNGKILTGALFYPFNYDPDKQYPMIVYIYEKLTMWRHLYQNPTLLDSEGFNRTNFTSQGYFVLCPDINYEFGKPGFSATDCVVAATKSAIGKAAIDGGRVGLIGHSFGGYETNFIITQTNMFKAAVGGSATSDLPQSYFSLAKSYARSKFWYFEYYQGRMGKMLFEDWDSYLKNSPVYHTSKVDTPLLLWTGAEDNQVSSAQSMAFYMALRRFNKDCTMLIYPKEGHAIKNEANQKDLSNKIINWFDHHLKGSSLQID